MLDFEEVRAGRTSRPRRGYGVTTEDEQEEFLGFITPEGDEVRLEKPEQMVEFIDRLCETRDCVRKWMSRFARFSARRGLLGPARVYAERALELSELGPDRAYHLLLLGQIHESSGDLPLAIKTYRKGLGYPQPTALTFYFLLNNLGYCLNLCGRHEQAEACCREATLVIPEQHNAHKNLGIALAGLGRYEEAARSYLTAAENCHGDPRALMLLEILMEERPELREEGSGLVERMAACRRSRNQILN